jgi:hypothetical protein
MEEYKQRMFYQMRQEMEDDDEDDDISGDAFAPMSFGSILESLDPEQADAIKKQMNGMTEE